MSAAKTKMRRGSAKKPPAWWYLADPYLRWAHHTDFCYFKHGKGARFGILVETKDELDKPRLQTLGSKGIDVSAHYLGRRFFTAELALAKRVAQLNAIAKIGALRMELATPVATPRSLEASEFDENIEKFEHLIGVIDDGCPFAHAELRSGNSSRVALLWDQGATKPHCRSTPSAYGYGYYFHKQALSLAIASGTPAGAKSPDEDAVYAAAGQDQLRPLASHGAHVLGFAAASVPTRSRISPSRFIEGDATLPPSWATDPSPRAALAFVQIPKESLDDSSGRWLDRNILDGIHAILDFARAKKVNRATINISFGPQTGAHDGSSLLELAIDDLVAKQDCVDELFVVLPVGNSCQSRAHSEFDLGQGGGSVVWHVPPDSETPAFLEIWLPGGADLKDIQVKIGSPDGQSLVALADQIAGSMQGSWHVVTINHARAGEPAQWVALVALGATGGYDEVPQPPHGRWSVSVMPLGKTAGIAHVYVARNDYNFGGLRRGKPSHLWHASYDPDKFMRSREYDAPQNPNMPRPTVQICSSGSVSGLATGVLSSVAAGYRIADSQPAIYSSAGPGRGIRQGPDWAYPTDESRVFPGLNSWGTRSGASVRLVGTSAASPQYARDLDQFGKQSLPPSYPPGPDPRTGWGRK